ncbi:hypothetical protein F4818DRAFT_27505 [Hypoxylon cercidicola]|nr:hypothetical protein F4818DRAFT_27505 [Hypoxylon cercidicola]
MSSHLSWEPEYCLACDRQTDGATYCSESCRLSDFEKTSSSNTPANIPGVAGSSSYNWSAPRSPAKFVLPPAYDFRNAQPYGSTPLPQSYLSQRSDSSASSTRVLTPSSSHSSLCSLRSTSSSGSESTQVSDKAKKQLRDYASSFEQARVQQQRRRSH